MSLVLQLLNCNACGGPLDVAPQGEFRLLWALW